MGAEPQQGLKLILGRARAGDERARGEPVALSKLSREPGGTPTPSG
jgi:hypothetical protein